MNILFYSRQCKTSLLVLRLLQSEGLLNNFKLICVDEHLDRIPPQITHVPTMIVETMKFPIVGNNILKWIESIRFIKNNKQPTANPPIIQENKNQDGYNESRPILGYIESEMSGISDNFAFKDIDIALPHAFVEYGKDDKNPIFTAPDDSTVKITAGDQNKRIRESEELRKKQDEEYQQVMKERQLYALLNNQK